MNLFQSCRSALNNQGMKLLRQNIAELSDKVASITQEKELLQSKMESLIKESDILKSTVISHSKNLPDITKNMMSLLSRMEQQFLLSNSKVVNGSQEDADENPEQMDTSYEHLLQWNQGSEEQQAGPRVTYITNHRQAPEAVNIPGIPQVAVISSPSQFEEERVVPMDSEVNALLVQLCEQQERNLQERNNLSRPTKYPTKQENTPIRKTNDYELLVSRRSARRPVKKSK
ncbi:hypothetical protein B566_EDAN006768 [Ephemera danica]|nr:hypothetical protein B566_EDAN006768 [Ephemera danica]